MDELCWLFDERVKKEILSLYGGKKEKCFGKDSGSKCMAFRKIIKLKLSLNNSQVALAIYENGESVAFTHSTLNIF